MIMGFLFGVEARLLRRANAARPRDEGKCGAFRIVISSTVR